MKTVAVICEYNPFHHGHALLFHRIRERFGEDSAILCIMSGSFVQRGEPAVLTKWARAKAAVCEGADLVLELPFPYSASAAERFARAGIAIADSLGCVDHLAFGSETGDTAHLVEVAQNMESEAFRASYTEVDANKAGGSAEKSAQAYAIAFGKEPTLLKPNDILGIEYIRSLIRRKSAILPVAFAREGAAHDEMKTGEIGSAMSARRLLYEGRSEELLSLLPCGSTAVLREELSAGRSMVSERKFLDLLLLHFRLHDAEQLRSADGLGGGLAERICACAQKAKTGEEFFSLVRTKRYTDAFLRRALLSGLFGVTRERLNDTPKYTQVLAFSEVGQKILSKIRKKTALPILTKPADYKAFPEEAKEAAVLSYRADSIYSALLTKPSSPSDLLRYSPYRKG